MVGLRIHDLAFQYAQHPVFSDASLAIEKGEVVSIEGRNGAGKSTLLQCLNHILKPCSGQVCVGELDVERMAPIARAREFGYLSQKSHSLFPSTVFEVVLTGRYPHSPVRFTRQDEAITAQVLADMGFIDI